MEPILGFRKEDLLRKVYGDLAQLTSTVRLNSAGGDLGINKTAEDFYGGLLNIVLNTEKFYPGIQLRNMNQIRPDYPAIDLGDEKTKVAVQVTTTEHRGKINHTLDKFFEKGLENTYNRLIILIIGKKDANKKRFLTQEGFDFSPNRDIWDMDRLGVILADLSEEKLEEIDRFFSAKLYRREDVKTIVNIQSEPGIVEAINGITKVLSSQREEQTKNSAKNVINYFDSDEKCYRKGRFQDIAGDYCGYYLDSNNRRSVLGAMIHIEEKTDDEMIACAIMGVRSDEVLFSETVRGVFARHTEERQKEFIRIKNRLSSNDKRCYWCEGTVQRCEELVVMELTAKETGAKWIIYLDVEEFYKTQRSRDDDCDLYRGGMGLTIAVRTRTGTKCRRMGLIRRTMSKQKQSLKNDEIRDMLKMHDGSEDSAWKPLSLDRDLDSKWYDWILAD